MKLIGGEEKIIKKVCYMKNVNRNEKIKKSVSKINLYSIIF
jgi:hypothetical protein